MPELTAIESSNVAFIEVALPIPLRRTFTYRVPAGLRDVVFAGTRVLVPLGKRPVTGYVVETHDALPDDVEIDPESIRDVIEIIDEEPLITREILRLTQWTADYYASSWGDVLKASLPAGINAAIDQIVVITDQGRADLGGLASSKSVRANVLRMLADAAELSVRELSSSFGGAAAKRGVSELVRAGLAATFHRTVAAPTKIKKRKAVRFISRPNPDEKALTEAHERVVALLESSGGELPFMEVSARADVGGSVLNTLAKRGIVEIFVEEALRDPLRDSRIPAIQDLVLTNEQETVLAKINGAIDKAEFSAFLLHGVTGSGKTEVYIRAMKHTVAAGRSALMLVPEIALTPVFSTRLRAVFGHDVAILHSNLSGGERFDEWRRIRRGDARIVIGTRSAVFAPLRDPGLLIIDEEQDGSYRQQEAPFYNARDVAVVRARFAGAVVVLGSATPAMETFYNSRHGKYEYLRLPNRIGDRPMAEAEIVDMREVFRAGEKDRVLSPQLSTAIEETHSRGEQSIILLNRRGFSQFLMCRSCGESVRCRNCDITLTFHKREQRLVCHYCNYRERIPQVCPACESKYLHYFGEGTEQIEDLLNEKFPNLRIARVDRDTMSRKRELEEILERFGAGAIDMLVGTQMLAKGHDFHNVTLVGVISVDAGLALPDFRSAERTFQLLTQAAGRAGRGELRGRVLIQTFYPGHYALRHARSQDYEGFYNDEIEFRRRMAYPPFIALASILIKHTNYQYAADNAAIVKKCLEERNRDEKCRILGVAPAPLARLKNEFRLQILVKGTTRAHLRQTLDLALHDAEQQFCDMKTVTVEIDPVSLL